MGRLARRQLAQAVSESSETVADDCESAIFIASAFASKRRDFFPRRLAMRIKRNATSPA